jgi:hypothetical protein
MVRSERQQARETMTQNKNTGNKTGRDRKPVKRQEERRKENTQTSYRQENTRQLGVESTTALRGRGRNVSGGIRPSIHKRTEAPILGKSGVQTLLQRESVDTQSVDDCSLRSVLRRQRAA